MASVLRLVIDSLLLNVAPLIYNLCSLMFPLTDAGMGMRLWWKTQREDGGILYSIGSVLFSVLEYDL